MRSIPYQVKMIGVNDRFGESGAPWELIKEFGISAEYIAATARDIHADFSKGKLTEEDLSKPMPMN